MRKAISLLLTWTIILSLMCGCSKNENPQVESNQTASKNQTNEYIIDSENSTEVPVSSAETAYPTPTNIDLSYGFVDHKQFSKYWANGTYRCGADFPVGDYYILSIYGANALYGVSSNPNDFTWSSQRVFRKVSPKDGEYVKVQYGGIMVPADEIDSSNLEQYGVFIVGKDLPEGDYKIVSISDYCDSEIANIQGIHGAFQICNSSPESEPESCNPLFEDQSYISVKNGQYLIINNLQMTLCGAEPVTEANAQLSSAETTEPNAEMGEPTQPEPKYVRLTVVEADARLNKETEKYSAILDDMDDIIDYWKTHDLIKAEEIKTYQNMWEAMSSKATEVEKVLTENRPPEEYDSLWLEIRDNMGEIAALCTQGINNDIDGDGEYSKDEMLKFLKSTGVDILDLMQEVSDTTNQLIKMFDSEKSDTKKTLPATQSKHTCEECGKSANHSIVSPFSGQTEYYCTEHYNELQDLVNQILGNNSSKNSGSSSSTQKTTGVNSARHTDAEAWSCAQNIVEGYLKSPSTAKFCSFVDAKVTHLGNGEYKVTGWVDSQNSFGAIIRSNFVVTYTATPKGYKNGVAAIS